MNLTPKILEIARLKNGRMELVEWHWPDMIDFLRTERDLMLEMSLPPHATDASAEFPEIDRGNHCFMGTMFVRYPHVALHGRGEGGHIRVLRCIFSDTVAASILGNAATPPLPVLQGLLDIRSDVLRTLMGLALREMTAQQERSLDALNALHELLVVELRRLFERQCHAASGGRLAAWQYRRVRDRLSRDGAPPTVAELAVLCGISVRHLNRQFLALTGSTIGNYVTNFWIDRAKAMLTEGDLPIKSVAFALGFSHPNSFARAFRRVTGSAPYSYRQRRSTSHDIPYGRKRPTTD